MPKPNNFSFPLKTNDQLIAVYFLKLFIINFPSQKNTFLVRNMDLANEEVRFTWKWLNLSEKVLFSFYEQCRHFSKNTFISSLF